MIILKYYTFFLCFVISIQHMLAQDYYVSDSNGSDSYAGTLEAPFKTINKGISMVSAGGTVYVMQGFIKMKIMAQLSHQLIPI